MPSITFRNRFGLIVALLGMAVGTGNIWRFPRVMAANGGGAFLIPWLLFLFLWSVPLLMVEFACGQKLRRGVMSCFAALSGGKYTWLGAFVVICTLGIMFYYSVVTGWCLFYAAGSVSGDLLKVPANVYWNSFLNSGYWPLVFHALAVLATTLVIVRGVRHGIETVSCALIPLLFLILILLAAYAFTLPGRVPGLEFIFNADFSKLTHYRVWLEALTQSAWSTGAGWGIALTYACYARDNDDPVSTPFTTGLGNNSIELLAVLVIVPTLFSFFPLNEVLELTSSGNTGLTFIALPGLFQQIPAGRVFAILFFACLFFAAFTSLISMFELGVCFFMDLGLTRKRAITCVAILSLLIGTPSALRQSFFDNQDWVWGIGLLLSGFFFAVLMRHVGMERICRDLLPLRPGFERGIFRVLVFWVIPLEFFVLIAWWFYQSVTWDPDRWWHPFAGLTIGACLFQWGILIVVLLFLNKRLSSRLEVSQT
ncbi:MAG: sodium-dependent transporter [Candidatus Omnitrophota bacterium]|nr:sodium-dependent transporter [Candidatus Omnitrophota bacterium]